MCRGRPLLSVETVASQNLLRDAPLVERRWTAHRDGHVDDRDHEADEHEHQHGGGEDLETRHFHVAKSMALAAPAGWLGRPGSAPRELGSGCRRDAKHRRQCEEDQIDGHAGQDERANDR